MTQFIINNRGGAKKPDANLFFTITGTPNGQMPGVNERKRRRKLAVNKNK